MSRTNIWIAGLIVVVISFAMFMPSLNNEFLRYDDEKYVYENPNIRSLAPENIRWIFTNRYFKSYTPLTLLSHAVDYSLYGLDPRGHHLTNVLLHALNAGWVFLLALMVLRRVFGSGNDIMLLSGAVIAGLLFSLHPLRVESVSWVSDRKDILMSFFLLPAFMCYLRYVRDRGKQGAKRMLTFAWILFLLAALTKTIAIIFPVVLLMLDWLLLERQSLGNILRTRLREKIPGILISGVIAIISVISAGREQTPLVLKGVTEVEKFLFPLYSPTFYLFKFIAPFNLMPVYLPPAIGLSIAYALVTLVVVGIATAMIVKWRTYVPAGLGFFVLFLLMTFFGHSAGIQPWADRYTYLPSVGLCVLLGGAAVYLVSRISARVVFSVAACVLIAYAVLSGRQMPYWKDSLSLWRYAVRAAGEPSTLTLVPLGVAFFYNGDVDSALSYYAQTIRNDSTATHGWINLGFVQEKQGKVDKAEFSYRKVIELDSLYLPAHNNLGNILLARGERKEAMEHYYFVLRHHGTNAEALFNVGVALEQQGKLSEAMEAYRILIRQTPGQAMGYINLGGAYMKQNLLSEAIATYTEGLRFDARNAILHFNLGAAYEAAGDTLQAIQSYTQAILAKGSYRDAYVNLGNLYAHAHLVENAAAVYHQALDAGLDSSDVLFNYGVVLEALGQRPEAMASYRKAMERDPGFLNAYTGAALLYARLGYADSVRHILDMAAKAGLDSSLVRSGMKSLLQ